MRPFTDEDDIGCCIITEGLTKEEEFNKTFSWIRNQEFKTLENGDLKLTMEFNSKSCKKHMQDKSTYMLVLIKDPITKDLTVEHMTCPDYNINKQGMEDCKHIKYGKRIMELYD